MPRYILAEFSVEAGEQQLFFILSVEPEDKTTFTPVIGARLPKEYCKNHAFVPDAEEEAILTIAHIFSKEESAHFAAIDRATKNMKLDCIHLNYHSLLQAVVEATASVIQIAK